MNIIVAQSKNLNKNTLKQDVTSYQRKPIYAYIFGGHIQSQAGGMI